MDFSILSGPWNVRLIARGRGIRELNRLRREYSGRNWRKLKGIARVRGLKMAASLLPNFIGMNAMALGKKKSKSNGISSKNNGRSRWRYVVCLNNRGYAGSLDRGKIYRVIGDSDAEVHGLIRVVDESGEDYLYPAKWFVAVELPAIARRAVAIR